MEIRLAYADGDLSLDIPEWVDTSCYGLNAPSRQVTTDEFAAAFERADGARWLQCARPLFIVNDGYRPTPTAQVLDWLDAADRTMLDRAAFLVACGTHEEPPAEHYRRIFGRHLERIRTRVSWHDCDDLGSMVKVGADRFGEPVYLNSLAAQAERIVVITSVEPHYFAGFTGGRKSLFPGLTDRATIERNHNLAHSLECRPLRLTGNPMAEQLEELLRLFDVSRVFAIQLVIDATHAVRDVFCGSIEESFRDAVAAANMLFAHEVASPFDLILAEVRRPLSGTLYQIQKALENTQGACADGGTVAVVADCRDGIGKRDFYDMANNWDRERNRPKDGVARLGSHKLSRVNAMTRRINVRLYSQLPDDQPRRVYYEPVHDLKALLGQCLRPRDRNRLAVVYDAGHTVMKLAGAS